MTSRTDAATIFGNTELAAHELRLELPAGWQPSRGAGRRLLAAAIAIRARRQGDA